MTVIRAQAPHHCRPPEIIVWGDSPPMEHEYDHQPPPILSWLPDGSRFICDTCGDVWVVETRETGYVNVMNHPAWYRETKRQRRQRLGLRWWQRERVTS